MIQKIHYVIRGNSTEDQEAIMALAVAVNKIIDALPKSEAPQGCASCRTTKTGTGVIGLDKDGNCRKCGTPVVLQGEWKDCGHNAIHPACKSCGTLPQETVEALLEEYATTYTNAFFAQTAEQKTKAFARRKEIIATLKSLTHHD